MGYKISINNFSILSKKAQIVNGIISDIEKGNIKLNSRLPSINAFSKTHIISRDTTEKAYNILKEKGYISTIPGKGNFVCRTGSKKIRVLMLLNKLSSYKKEVYEGFMHTLGSNVHIELKIYHYDPDIFRQMVIENLGKFHYMAIMPHFYAGTPEESYMEVLRMVDPKELVILDRQLPINESHIAVFQDFNKDIFESFYQHRRLFEKYKRLTILFPPLSHHPEEILEGIKEFCEKFGLEFFVNFDSTLSDIQAGDVFVTLIEEDLGSLIKKVNEIGLILGNEIGIVSFNETVFKELLDITVVTTDFKGMGAKAAQMIIKNQRSNIRNNFRLIPRKSL